MDQNTLHTMLAIAAIEAGIVIGVIGTLLYLASKAVDAFAKLCDAAAAWLYADTISKEKKPKRLSTQENPFQE
jgi:hypothetical protein